MSYPTNLVTSDARIAATKLLDPELDDAMRKCLVAYIAATPHGFRDPFGTTTNTFSPSNFAALEVLRKKDFSPNAVKGLAELVIDEPGGLKGFGHEFRKQHRLEKAFEYSVISGKDFDEICSDNFKSLLNSRSVSEPLKRSSTIKSKDNYPAIDLP